MNINNREEKLEKLTILLMYLTSWEEESMVYDDETNNVSKTKLKNAWKGYDFDILNKLSDKGYLYPFKYKNKSVTLTKDGEQLAEEIIKEYFEEKL